MKSKEKEYRIALRVDMGLYEEAARVAKDEDKSISAVVRTALREYVERLSGE